MMRKDKFEINEKRQKEITKAISTPEGRIRIAIGAYELLPSIHQYLVTKTEGNK